MAQGGLLALGYAAGRVVALLVFNLFLSKVPLKWLLAGAALLQAVALALPAVFAHSLGPLMAALAVLGAAVTVPVVVPVIWIGAYAKHSTERAMLKILVFFALGVVVAPLVIGAALTLGAGWRWVFMGEAGFSVLRASPFWPFHWRTCQGGRTSGCGICGRRRSAPPVSWRTLDPPAGDFADPGRLLRSDGRLHRADRFREVARGLGGLHLPDEVWGRRRLSHAVEPHQPVSGQALRAAFSIITLVVIVSGAVFAYAAGPVAEVLGMRGALALAAVPAAAVVALSFSLPKTLKG